MHNLKELTGRFIVAIVTSSEEYLRVTIKGMDEVLNVVKGIPDEPLQNLIHCVLGKTNPVLPIRIFA